MADVSVELHALEEELLSFIEEIVKEFKLSVCVMSFPPFDVKEIDISDLRKATSDTKTDRVALTISPPSLPWTTFLKFLDHNPGTMTIDLGRLTEQGLKESWLTARTSNPAVLDTWRRVARKLRSRTKAGAIAINPETGASSKVRTHRFTKGALNLHEQGVAMLSLTNSAVFRPVD